MRGIDLPDSQYIFPKGGEFKTRGHRFKVRGERHKSVQRGNSVHTEGGECLEQAARDSSRGGYNFIF